MLGVMYVLSVVVAVVVAGGVLGALLVRGLGRWNAQVWDKELTRTDEPLQLPPHWRPR